MGFCKKRRPGHAAAAIGLFLAHAAWAGQPAQIAATVQQGVSFQHAIGGRLFLRLIPQGGGWGIEIGPAPGIDFAGVVTPPFHGPNALQLYGWHFTATGMALGLGEGAKRHVQFVLTRAAQAKEERDLEAMLYLPAEDPEHRRAVADWGTAPLGTCWLRPDNVTLGPPGNQPGDQAILAMHFTAACALSGGNHYIAYLP